MSAADGASGDRVLTGVYLFAVYVRHSGDPFVLRIVYRFTIESGLKSARPGRELRTETALRRAARAHPSFRTLDKH